MNGKSIWQAQREQKAFLALEDGTVFRGYSIGAPIDRVGEVVFNTGMCGYQEIISDPSYAGQFVTMTYPEIGNYGVNSSDMESRSLFLNGLIIHNGNEPSLSWLLIPFVTTPYFSDAAATTLPPGHMQKV